MCISYHGAFGNNVIIRVYGILNFGGPKSVATNINNVIYSTDNPIHSMLISARAITGKIVPFILRTIGISSSFMIAIVSAAHAWPREANG